MFDFSEALSYLKTGFKVKNDRGVYYIEDNILYFIPHAHYPNGKRKVVRIYSDAILTDNWELYNE